MKIENAIKIIIVLLVVIILTLIGALVIMIAGDNEPKGTETAPQHQTTPPEETTPEETTTPEQTTTPEGTTTPEQTTTPEGTTTPEQTTTPEDTTTPPTSTTDPDVTAPDGFTMNKTYLSDTGSNLNLKAVLTANKTTDGKVKVKVELYLVHYNLYINAKGGNKLTLGDVTKTFKTEKFNVEDDSKQETLLASIEGVYEYGDTVDLEAVFHANCTYGGKNGAVELEEIVINESVTLE